MSSTTKIEWADATWNPLTGCSKISEGCQNCYAERMAKRLAGRHGYPKDFPFSITGHRDKLDDPQKIKKPTRFFVCSMGDLFHDDVKYHDILTMFDIMHKYTQHTFMLLTKRPRKMLYFAIKYGLVPYKNNVLPPGLTPSGQNWPSNVWAGISAENQQRYDERIPLLMQVPAPVKFVSCEPLLGRIDLHHCLYCQAGTAECHEHPQLDWVIVGGETGSNARPMYPDWVTNIRDQCIQAHTPFFFKGWGTWVPHKPEHGGPYFSELVRSGSSTRDCKWLDKSKMRAKQDWSSNFLCVGKKKAGRTLDGQEWSQLPTCSIKDCVNIME